MTAASNNSKRRSGFGIARLTRLLGLVAIASLWLGLIPAVSAAEPSFELPGARHKLNWIGYARNETAYRFKEPRSFTKIRNTLALRGTYRATDRIELTVAGRTYYDLVYDVFNYDSVTARAERDSGQPLVYVEGLDQGKDNIAEIRELYLDLRFDSMDVRIGKQFVIWGVLTGVRIIDEINPMDFRELILPDLLDYRIPLWTLRTDYYGRATNYQFLWIPDVRFHKPAPPGSEWELLQEVPGTVYPDTFTWEDSEFGFKADRTFDDTDLSLSYFYTWDDFPVIFREAVLNQRVDPNVGTVVGDPNSTTQGGGTAGSTGTGDEIIQPEFYPTYTRMHILGMSFRRLVQGQVLKGEFAYVADKYFGIKSVDRNHDTFLDGMGVVRKDHLRWGLGLDFNYWRTDFSPAFTQSIILAHNEDLIQPRYDTSFNLFVRKELPSQSALFEFLGIYLVTLEELFLKPKLTLNVTDHLQFIAGMDLFFGQASQTGVTYINGRTSELKEVAQRTQFVGNFSNNDRVFFEFKYSF